MTTLDSQPPFDLDRLTPEQRQEACLAASESLVEIITTILSPDNEGKYDAELAEYTMRHESAKWLRDHSQFVQTGVDEFEINKDLVVLHPEHDQHDKHSRLTLRQLGAWVDLQNHNKKTE